MLKLIYFAVYFPLRITKQIIISFDAIGLIGFNPPNVNNIYITG